MILFVPEPSMTFPVSYDGVTMISVTFLSHVTSHYFFYLSSK